MIVALIGRKRSGKDTVARLLIEEYGFYRYAFADPIREAAGHIFLWTLRHMEDKKEEIDPRWGISPRQAMQHLGTEWGQFALGEKYPTFKDITGRKLWVKRFIEWRKENDQFENVVISDTRFSHEIEEIKNSIELEKEKKLFIRIARPDLQIEKDMHESEKHVDELFCNYQIMNNRSIGNLFECVKKVMDKETGE